MGSFDNRAGLIKVADQSRFSFVSVGGPLFGGTLQSLGAASLRGGGTFDGVTLRGGFVLAAGSFVGATMYDNNSITGNTAERQTVGIGGSLVNNGTLSISGGGSANEAGTLQLISDTILSGSGQTVLGSRIGNAGQRWRPARRPPRAFNSSHGPAHIRLIHSATLSWRCLIRLYGASPATVFKGLRGV